MSKWPIRFLDLAKTISTWSLDPSTKIGCVVINDKRQVLSIGYNGFPRSINDTDERLLDRETKYKYVVHAEANAIYNACQNGVSLEGSTIYIYGLPICNECAKAIIQVGIKKVVMMYGDIPEKWSESFKFSEKMFREAEVMMMHYNLDGEIIDE
jgi:dCMP deaminase